LSSTNSGVQLDDQVASTSTNIKISSPKITPKRKRRKYYVGDITTPDLTTLRKAKFYYNNAIVKILSDRKRIKVLNQKINRLKKRLSSMTALIAHLKSKNPITEEAHDTIYVYFKKC